MTPASRWARAVTLAATLAVLSLGTFEWELRSRGYQPSQHDSAELWWKVRAGALADPPPVVIVGSSRAQLGIEPVILGHELSGRPGVQLAINGSNPLLVVENLAADPKFRGTLVVEIQPYVFASGIGGMGVSQSYLANPDTASWWRSPEMELRGAVQSAFVFRNPYWRPILYPKVLQPATWQSLFYLKVRVDRFVQADYGGPGPYPEQVARWARVVDTLTPMTDDETEVVASRLRAAAVKIHGRGGQTVFVYLPGGDAMKTAEEARFPRTRYWDRLAAVLPAPCIHVDDESCLKAEYHLPDGSHLDQRTAPAFTRVLAGVLRDKLREHR